MLVSLIAGCASGSSGNAKMVSHPGQVPYGPTGQNNGGIIEYVTGDGDEANRKEAYKQMSIACGGHYQIDGENLRDSGYQYRSYNYRPSLVSGRRDRFDASLDQLAASLGSASATVITIREIRFSCIQGGVASMSQSARPQSLGLPTKAGTELETERAREYARKYREERAKDVVVLPSP